MLEVVKAGEWYAATTRAGQFGYVREKEVALRDIVTPRAEAPQPKQPWRPQGKINLTWEHVVSRNPDVAAIKDMPGLNVVSPTWFSVIDDQGTVKNKADSRYVRWAHARGYKVWALVDNGFDPARTSAVLSDLRKRESIIQQILAYASLYSLDGINIDFENINYSDRGLLVQFVREMAPLCREQGLVVSMDVTFKSKSLNWSMCYDRKALAQAVDYIMVMGYDEHTAGSPVAGSVGSLPWVEEGLQAVLEEVPADRLLLGVPFYTRLWREETKNGVFTVTSKALGMEAAEETLRQNRAVIQWDAVARQNFGVFREGQAQCKIWLEDQESMALRVALVKKYGLAGIASWRRGFEKPAIWNVILNGLTQ
jgi:spore germination protein YaaH